MICSVSNSGITIAPVITDQPMMTHGPSRPSVSSNRRMKTNPTGITSNVNNVDVTNPPITIVANGGQISFS